MTVDGWGPAEPGVILIAGPTTTGKSRAAWELARDIGGAAIVIDAFQIHSPLPAPCGLGVGLSAEEPPAAVPAYLYRTADPRSPRPTPDDVARLAAGAADHALRRGLVPILEGGSISATEAVLARLPVTAAFVFELGTADGVRRAIAERVLRMGSDALLAEAASIRDRGLERSWVVRLSSIYRHVFPCLDGTTGTGAMMSAIYEDAVQLAFQQAAWFEALRPDRRITWLRSGTGHAHLRSRLELSGRRPADRIAG